MAGYVTLPPKHITARALWWLTQCPIVFGGITYPIAVGLAGCAVPQKRAHPNASPVIDWVVAAKLKTSSRVVPAVQGEGGHMALPEEWTCGTADVRAIWISGNLRSEHGTPDIKVVTARPTNMTATEVSMRTNGEPALLSWATKELTQPTCNECKVLLDQALANCMPKYGKAPTSVTDGRLDVWLEWKRIASTVANSSDEVDALLKDKPL